MSKKLMLTSLLFVLLFASSACSLIWPRPEVVDLPQGNTGQPPNISQPTGSFLPPVIPTSGSAQKLRTVYLLDHQGRFLVPYVLGVDNAEGIAKAVLARLVDQPENASALAGTDFRLPLPTGTTVLGMTVRDGVAVVDFNPSFLQFADAGHERMAIDAVVYTLTEFSTIDRVELRVSGRPIGKLPSGLELPLVVGREDRDLNLEVSSRVSDVSLGSKVRLYFPASGATGSFVYFVPVTRVIPNSTDQPTAAVLELLSGPTSESGLVGSLPKTAELRSVRLVGDTLQVDFSSGLTGYGGGSAAEQALIGSLLLTLTEIPGVNKVQITIAGQNPNLPEGTDLSRPVSRPIFVNPFII